MIGPAYLVFPDLIEFEREFREMCGLELQRHKCRVFPWDSTLPLNSIPGMPIAGIEKNDKFDTGMMVYEVLVAADEYVKSMMEIKMEEIASTAFKACTVLSDERQAL